MRTSSVNYGRQPPTAGLTGAANVARTGMESPLVKRSFAQPPTTSGAPVSPIRAAPGERLGGLKEVGAAVYRPQYEVPWQLLGADYEDESGADEADEGWPTSDHGPQSLARSAGLLTRADISAVIACQDGKLTVETASALALGLLPGVVLYFEDHLGPAGKVAVGSLLAGRSAWVDCLPPRGFRSAALIAAASLAPSKRLVLVASIHRRFEKRDLGFAAAYLAQAREVANVALPGDKGASPPGARHPEDLSRQHHVLPGERHALLRSPPASS